MGRTLADWGGGGGLRGRGLQGPWCGLGNVVAWVTLGKQSFALRESASLSVKCHGGSKTGLWQRLQTQAAGGFGLCFMWSAPWFAKGEFIADIGELEGLATKRKSRHF